MFDIFMKKFFTSNFNYLNTTIIAILIWWLIFGLKISFEPFIWDDLSFFRNYTKEELLNSGKIRQKISSNSFHGMMREKLNHLFQNLMLLKMPQKH